MTDPKIQQALDVATDMVADSAPGFPALADIVTKLAEVAEVSEQTARKRIRAAVADGALHELAPDYGWFVSLPGGEEYGFSRARITRKRRDNSLASPISWGLTNDPKAERPGTYGPTVTLITTPGRITELLSTWAEDKKSAEQAEKEAREAKAKAERQEIDRREPGLRLLMRRLRFVLHHPRTEGNFSEANTHLFAGLDRNAPYSEHTLAIDIKGMGEQETKLLRAIIEAGLADYLARYLPDISCAHCKQRIVHTDWAEGDSFWWHVKSTNEKCQGADTVAEPAQ